MSYVNAFLRMVLRGVYLAHKTLSVMHYNNICMVPGSVLNKAHDKEKSAKSYPSDVHATKQSQNLLKCGCVKWQEMKKSFHWFGRKKWNSCRVCEHFIECSLNYGLFSIFGDSFVKSELPELKICFYWIDYCHELSHLL